MMPEPVRLRREIETQFAVKPFDRRSRDLRHLAVRGMRGGGRGHLGSAFSAIEILRVLYDDVMAVRPEAPDWPERDRCLLSKGHGCLALYAILADKGFFPTAELDRFCLHDGILGGHPDANKIPGVEASTGALGHGPSIGLGMALAGRMRGADWRVFVVTGDGEINEGSVWEAAMTAAKHRLDNYCLIVDYNKHQSYAATAEVLELEPLWDKLTSFGFTVRDVDGHDIGHLRETFAELPFEAGRPNAVICHTIKGRGVDFAENNLEWHHKSKIPDEEYDRIAAAIEA
jgi:transketolase